MKNSNDTTQNSALHVIAWMFAALIGLVAILLSVILEQPPDHTGKAAKILSGLLNGVGIACVTAAMFETLVRFYNRLINGYWYRYHIEIFAIRRVDAPDKYEKENEDIHDSLKLMGFSAKRAIRDLAPGNSLYRAFVEHGAEIQVLIVDPSSPAAEQQARVDNQDYPDTAMETIRKSFEELNQLNQKYKQDKAVQKPTGTLTIRLITENPSVTLYIKDDAVVIFGHYFLKSRGDECAAMKIAQEWNSKVFAQYKDFFDGKWVKADASEIMRIARGSVFFDEDKFSAIVSVCARKIEDLKKSRGLSRSRLTNTGNLPRGD